MPAVDDSLLNDPPRGFTVERDGDAIRLHYKRVPVPIPTVVMSLVLVIWIGGGSYVLMGTPASSLGDLLIIVLWALCALWMLHALLAVFFTRLTVSLSSDELVIEPHMIRPLPTRRLRRDAITGVRQAIGRGDFPYNTFELELYAPKRLRLIWIQPYETSLWLGRVLGEWSGVRFNHRQPAPTVRDVLRWLREPSPHFYEVKEIARVVSPSGRHDALLQCIGGSNMSLHKVRSGRSVRSAGDIAIFLHCTDKEASVLAWLSESEIEVHCECGEIISNPPISVERKDRSHLVRLA